MEPTHLPDSSEKRQTFLLKTGSAYAYGLGDVGFQQQCETEYPSLLATTYLDYAASAPAPLSTFHRLAENVATTLYSNPHSRSTSSVTTSLEVEQCRGRVLEDLFGIKTPSSKSQWDIIFTSGATASLKLVGDAFPWQAGAKYCYLKQSHTSLVGIRGCALARGAGVNAMDVDDMLEYSRTDSGDLTLFAYPAQCNATGQRLGLRYSRLLKQRHPNACILVDAAAYVSTAVLDLGSVPLEDAPDFIALSFYKVFGYPTGLGCLVVKRSSASFLKRDGYFGGGTIDAISVSAPFWSQPRRSLVPGPVHERFEDGSVPFLNIIALGHALDTHRRLYKSHRHVSAHVSTLLQFATYELSQIRHANDCPVVKQHLAFGTVDYLEEPGPIIGFSLLGTSSEFIGHVHLEQLATVNGFQLRTGRLCNSGVVSGALDISDKDLLDEYARGRSCWDDDEFGGVDQDVHRPLGMARISFGASSSIDDVLHWLAFIRRYFVVSETVVSISKPLSQEAVKETRRLQTLVLYPIKSCAGQSLPNNLSWQIVPTGLLYDREWMLLDASSGKTLSQKQYPRMALVRPSVDLHRRILVVCAPGTSELLLPLDIAEEGSMAANVCSDAVAVSSSGKAADEWFSSFLGVQCTLQRLAGGASRHAHFDRAASSVPILLSNESPFLLITQSSVDQVNDWIAEGSGEDAVHSACFRANFLLNASMPPFFEDTVDLFRIGTETFQVLARCRRCLMVCVNQKTGRKTKEPFNCLARKRKSTRGKIEFGVHLMWREDLSQGGSMPTVCAGDPVDFASLREDTCE
ncbi:molybdenum cofactor sulfurase [Mycena galericulata]|nr:molybdenum cofactor sulfurase [Mycena galericulata]